jgi:hypothetical protein
MLVVFDWRGVRPVSFVGRHGLALNRNKKRHEKCRRDPNSEPKSTFGTVTVMSGWVSDCRRYRRLAAWRLRCLCDTRRRIPPWPAEAIVLLYGIEPGAMLRAALEKHKRGASFLEGRCLDLPGIFIEKVIGQELNEDRQRVHVGGWQADLSRDVAHQVVAKFQLGPVMLVYDRYVIVTRRQLSMEDGMGGASVVKIVMDAEDVIDFLAARSGESEVSDFASKVASQWRLHAFVY